MYHAWLNQYCYRRLVSWANLVGLKIKKDLELLKSRLKKKKSLKSVVSSILHLSRFYQDPDIKSFFITYILTWLLNHRLIANDFATKIIKRCNLRKAILDSLFHPRSEKINVHVGEDGRLVVLIASWKLYPEATVKRIKNCWDSDPRLSKQAWINYFVQLNEPVSPWIWDFIELCSQLYGPSEMISRLYQCGSQRIIRVHPKWNLEFRQFLVEEIVKTPTICHKMVVNLSRVDFSDYYYQLKFHLMLKEDSRTKQRIDWLLSRELDLIALWRMFELDTLIDDVLSILQQETERQIFLTKSSYIPTSEFAAKSIFYNKLGVLALPR